MCLRVLSADAKQALPVWVTHFPVSHPQAWSPTLVHQTTSRPRYLKLGLYRNNGDEVSSLFISHILPFFHFSSR